MLLAVFLVFALITICVYAYRARSPAIPPIPAINLDGADPEVAKAIDAVVAELERSPRSVRAWGELAAVCHANGFDEAADVGYEASAKLDGKNPLWPYLRGYLHQRGPGGPAAALPYFERAVSLDPSNSIFVLRLADTLLELDRLDEAENRYLQVLAADNKDSQALFGLGKLAVARQDYQKSLKYLVPIAESPLVRNQAGAVRASVYDQLGNHLDAEHERRRLARLPDDQMRVDDPMQHVIQREIGVQVLLRTAQVLWQKGRVDEVEALAQEAVQRYPDSDVAWSSLSNVLASTNNVAEAEKAIVKSISLAPKTAEYRVSLGKLHLTQRRYSEAVEGFQKALELNSRDAQTYLLLGRCQEELGNRALAKEAYQQALRYEPDFEEARLQLEKLKDSP